MKKRSHLLAVSSCAALLLAAISAKAGIVVTSDKAGASFNSPFSLGYVFTVNSQLSLTALGQFDILGDGAVSTSKIALFDWDTGAKLTETTLADAVKEETGFYDTFFKDITPVNLIPGTRYLVATEAKVNDFAFGTGIVTFDSSFTWLEGRATTNSQPAMPATATTSTFSIQHNQSQAYFGPNMKVVPEPTTAGLLGLAGLVFSLRRRGAGARR